MKHLLVDGPRALMSGKNPYTTSMMYVPGPKYFPYWPFSLISEIPFIFLFSDARILLIFSDLLAGLFIFWIGRGTVLAELLSVLYLFRPHSVHLVSYAWLTPLESVMFFSIVYAYQKKLYVASSLLGGLLICTKPQYVVVFLFFLIGQLYWKRMLAVACLVMSILVFPFLYVDARAFFSATVFYHLSPLEGMHGPVGVTLSFPTAWSMLFHSSIPSDIGFVCLIISMTISIVWVLFKTGKMHHKERVIPLHKRVGGSFLSLFTIYLFFPYSYVSYYYLLSSIFIVWYLLVVQNEDTSIHSL